MNDEESKKGSDDLSEIERITLASTPDLKWGPTTRTDAEWLELIHKDESPEHFVVHRDAPDGAGSLFAAIAVTGNGPTSEANAMFFAGARGVVLMLIAEVRALRAARAEEVQSATKWRKA